MRTSAVICELNPPHNGHKYIFEEIRKRSGSDYLIAVMSGNYVQRGEPAIVDKFTRARIALMMGADLVLEIPSPFSFQSAREFAMAGVSLVAASGIIDVLGFGAEFPDDNNGNNDVSFSDMLKEAAAILLEEPPAYKEVLKAELKKGASYPLASECGLKACGIEAAEIISSPNNILAREYLRALKQLSSDIEPLIIPRLGDGYNDDIPKDTRFASATALRRLLLSGASLDEISAYIPAELCGIYEDIISGGSPLLSPDDMSDVLNLRLLSRIHEGLDPDIFDLPKEIYNRIIRDGEKALTFTERALEIKSKGYTYTRVCRALLNLSLGVAESEVTELKEKGYVPYIRILGFRQQASGLLSALKEHAAVPIVSNAASGRDQLGRSVFYDNIYYSLMSSARRQKNTPSESYFPDSKNQTEKNPIRNEYERQIVII